MISKKAAVQITATFLVSLVVGIVLFSLGLTFIYKFSDFANTQGEKHDEKLASEVRRNAVAGNSVYVYESRVELSAGDAKRFYVGIANDLGSDKFFRFDVKSKGNVDTLVLATSDADDLDWKYNPDLDENDNKPVFNIKSNEVIDSFFAMFVPDNVVPGKHMFVVNFESSDSGTGNWESYKSPILVIINIKD